MVVLQAARYFDLVHKSLVENLVMQLGRLWTLADMVLVDIALECMVGPTKRDKVAEFFYLGHFQVALLAHT